MVYFCLSNQAVYLHQIVLTNDANQTDELFDVLEGNRRWYCNTQTMNNNLIVGGWAGVNYTKNS